MLLLVRGSGWEDDKFVGLLVLRMQRCVLGTLGSLFLDTLVMLLWFDPGPLAQGHCSSVVGHLMSSIVSAGDGLVPFDHRIVCFPNRMGGFVCCLGMGFVGRDLSI